MTPEELAENLDNVEWRLSNLYKIITKGEDDDLMLDSPGLVITFTPNASQQQLLATLWYRNIILKARQLGFTTLITILWLDTALFSKSPIRCGIIAQDKEAAENIFREKVKFAYENLPTELRDRFPLKRDSASELLFEHNGSSIRVATSMRSGTIHRLHISEFGKICAKAPEKATEIVTGSIPTVPNNGILVIESTAEGQDGPFYTMTERAKGQKQQGAKLSPKDFRLHFFPWWSNPAYAIDPDGVLFTEADQKYFLEIESKTHVPLSLRQRAWYVATRDSDFSGDPTLMWQEYPSTPEEAFQVSTEGCYYATQIATARLQGRILPHIPKEALPVNTFWDLGRSDFTAVWLHQRVGPENRFIGYYEASGEELDHFALYLQNTGYTFGTHYLPHDAEAKRLGMTPDTNRSYKEMLETLMPGQRFHTVPVITTVMTGIQATRNVFSSCWFDQTACKVGIQRLSNYKKKWVKATGSWSSEAEHDDNSHGADAFRQFGQEADNGNRFSSTTAPPSSRRRRRGTSMAV